MAAVASEVSILERARPALAAEVDELRNKISAVEQRVTAARQALEAERHRGQTDPGAAFLKDSVGLAGLVTEPSHQLSLHLFVSAAAAFLRRGVKSCHSSTSWKDLCCSNDLFWSSLAILMGNLEWAITFSGMTHQRWLEI